MIELLTLFYKDVKITKPLTSRPASSERYVICQDFNGASIEQVITFDLINF